MVKFFPLAIALITFLVTFVEGENWVVIAGAGGLDAFSPTNFDANEGDTVTFQFVNGTHNVIQADAFATCIKSTKPDAFSTSTFPGQEANPPRSMWAIKAPSAPPSSLYYFCSVEDHCSGDKMYGQINVLAKGAPIVNSGTPGPINPAPTSTSSPAAASPSPTAKSNDSNNKQVSFAVVGGALLSLIIYFL